MAKKKEEKNVCIRIPIVAILGHVDHGKTTILDKIRESDGGCTKEEIELYLWPSALSEVRFFVRGRHNPVQNLYP